MRGPAAADGSTVNDTPTERFGATGSDQPTERFGATPAPGADLPTERLGASASGDDAPTRRYEQLPPVAPPPPPPGSRGLNGPGGPGGPGRDPEEEARRRRNLLVLLGCLGVLLLAGVVVLVLSLVSRPGAQVAATPSPTPTAESLAPEPEAPAPEPEPEAPEEPAAPPLAFDDFQAPTTVQCPDETSSVPLTFSWRSATAERAYIGVQTADAAQAPYAADLPPTATYTDLAYQCSEASQVYTVTLEDAAGARVHESVTVTREGP